MCIRDMLHDIGRTSFGSISEKIVEITDVGFNNIIEFDCEKCSSKSSTPIMFDPTLFFA